MSGKLGFVKVATGSFEVNVGNPAANGKEIVKIIQQAEKRRSKSNWLLYK